MDSVRYYLALVLVLTMPGVYLYWFSIHPFVKFWRRVGPWRTIVIHYAMMTLVAVAIFQIRRPLLAVEYGTNLVLILLAVPLYVFAGVFGFRIRRQLRVKTLQGFPELAPEKYGRKLLTEGVYARIRHPRYVEILLALVAYSLFCNYLAVYVIVLAGVPWVMLVARIEEKELRERFGPEYEDYCRHVPRFLPRF